jgi:acetyl esterase/lipase
MRNVERFGTSLQRSLILAGLVCFQAFVIGCTEAETHNPDAKGLTKVTETASVEGRKEGVWQPPAGHQQTPLWPGAAPNMADLKLPPEYSETAMNPKRFAGRPVTGVFNVTVPTLTVFLAKQPGNGAAMLVFPGGGFSKLAIDLEGTEVCDWLMSSGTTCVLVKYRVPKSNHHYDEDCDCAVTPKHLLALQDAQRAIRLVRSRASELKINPRRIGVIGFSAGGYLVAQTSNIFEPVYEPVDEIDKVSSRPDFAIAMFPGHLCRAGGSLDPGIKVTKMTPPTFLLQAWDDPVDPICNSTVYARALDEAGVPSEVHLFAKGGHAFAMRPLGHPVERWPMLVEDWLKDTGIL